MQTSELFLALVRRLAFCFLLLVAAVGLCRAQAAGTVGIYTREVTVFTNQSTTKASKIFPDFGFGCNFLAFKNSSFLGSIDVEWSPTGAAPFYPLVQANYLSASDSGYHTLQVGGYWPNMRSTVTQSGGSLSAWYGAQAGPCPLFSSGLGSNGPTSPIVCDQNAALTISSTASTVLIPAVVGSGYTVVICGLEISFPSAPSGSSQLVWAATNACSGTPIGPTLLIDTPAASPLLIPIALSQRSPQPNGYPYPCFSNSSGVNAVVSISYATVYGL